MICFQGVLQKSVTVLSSHLLEENGSILEQPEKFKIIEIPDNTKLEHTNFVALGHSSSEPLVVKKYQIDETTHYCVEVPENKDLYLLVKQLLESL